MKNKPFKINVYDVITVTVSAIAIRILIKDNLTYLLTCFAWGVILGIIKSFVGED